MKHLILITLLGGCFIRPVITPFGCQGATPVCICDSDSNCEWVWTCTN